MGSDVESTNAFTLIDLFGQCRRTSDDFTFVNASVAWRPIRGNSNVSLLLKADNIFDVTGRRHASFTKDFVPLAGRNFKVSARLSF